VILKAKNTFYVIGAVVAIVLVIFFILQAQKGTLKSAFEVKYFNRDYEPALGFFNQANLTYSPTLNLKHRSLVWTNTSVGFNKDEFTRSLDSSDVLLTIETWHKDLVAGRESNILNDILSGTFDKKIAELGTLISKSKNQVFIRWAPDMEVPEYRYPWQYQAPALYVKAFNHFASHMRQSGPKAKIVWAPLGYPGDTEYWPGDKYVDAVSVTLSNSVELSNISPPLDTTRFNLLQSKLHRMRFINKPVLLIGTDNITRQTFNTKLLKAVADTMAAYKETVYSARNYDINRPKPIRTQPIIFGLYDAAKRLTDQTEIKVEHIFVNVGEVQTGSLKKSLDSIQDRHHAVILTMEPWRDTTGKEDKQIMLHVAHGKYEAEFKKLYTMLADFKYTVYLRFAHEMEIPIHRYSWQSQNPVNYITAYRRFMLLNKNASKNIKRVWGPAGDRGSADFWPGDDVVDYISVAIYGLPDKNITDHNKQEKFSTIFNRKFYRMRFLNRPIFMTEFGVKGPEDYQTEWLVAAANTLKSNQNVFGACYFNLFDNPKAWGKIKAPDWSISKKTFKRLAKELND
jgi:beta-mannanase